MRGLTEHPQIKTLHKIAMAFHMTLAEFLSFREPLDLVFEEDDDL